MSKTDYNVPVVTNHGSATGRTLGGVGSRIEQQLPKA